MGAFYRGGRKLTWSLTETNTNCIPAWRWFFSAQLNPRELKNQACAESFSLTAQAWTALLTISYGRCGTKHLQAWIRSLILQSQACRPWLTRWAWHHGLTLQLKPQDWSLKRMNISAHKSECRRWVCYLVSEQKVGLQFPSLKRERSQPSNSFRGEIRSIL